MTIISGVGFPDAISQVMPRPTNVPVIRCVALSQICLELLPCITAKQEMGIQYGFSMFNENATAKEKA
ncbi:hypothetical protein L950_0228265 [Sphingobacterium sp. IITKGP-BTPF85]|nr:hypothetical protein L950_0228265 [Sphingobacterium sp. IITKGP-BTPF85]